METDRAHALCVSRGRATLAGCGRACVVHPDHPVASARRSSRQRDLLDQLHEPLATLEPMVSAWKCELALLGRGVTAGSRRKQIRSRGTLPHSGSQTLETRQRLLLPQINRLAPSTDETPPRRRSLSPRLGEVDWGASLFTSTRWNRTLVLAEVGYLHLGDPGDFAYRPLVSGSLSVSHRPRGFSLYPLASVLVSSSSRTGDPLYTEISAGVGFPTSRRTSLSVLLSKGLTSVTPDASAALLFSWRP